MDAATVESATEAFAAGFRGVIPGLGQEVDPRAFPIHSSHRLIGPMSRETAEGHARRIGEEAGRDALDLGAKRWPGAALAAECRVAVDGEEIEWALYVRPVAQ
jgi:hypothetical protein